MYSPKRQRLTANPSMKVGLGPDPSISELPASDPLPCLFWRVRTSLQKWRGDPKSSWRWKIESTFYAPKLIWSMSLFSFCLKINRCFGLVGHFGFSFWIFQNYRTIQSLLKSSKLGTKKFEYLIRYPNFLVILGWIPNQPQKEVFFPVVLWGSMLTPGLRSRKSDLGAKRSRSLPPGPIRRRPSGRNVGKADGHLTFHKGIPIMGTLQGTNIPPF